MGARWSYASRGPPGISDGPRRAPCSPPDTPMPMNRMPLRESSRARRSVSENSALPPSTRMSPGSRNGASEAIVASVGAPALIITRMRRGRSNEVAKVCGERCPWIPCRASESRASTGSDDRSDTAVEKPLSARFFPMTPSPYTPICAAIDRPIARVSGARSGAPRSLHLARGGIGRQKARGESLRVGVVLVDQGLELLQAVRAGAEPIAVDAHRGDELHVVMVAGVVLRGARAGFVRDLEERVERLGECLQHGLAVEILGNFAEALDQVVDGHRGSFRVSSMRVNESAGIINGRGVLWC